MRVTPLDGAYPISYHQYFHSAAVPIWTTNPHPSTSIQSLKTWMAVQPLLDLGSIPWPALDDKRYLRLASLIPETPIRPIAARSHLAHGYYMPIPLNDDGYVYQISGSLVPSTQNGFSSMQGHSLIVGHLDHNAVGHTTQYGTVNEIHRINITNEFPLSRQFNGTFNTYDGVYFNFSLFDLGVPPTENSHIYFGIKISNYDGADSILYGFHANINVWRMHSPIKAYNEWQA